MSYHVDFPYMIPNGFASSETENNVIGHDSDYMNLSPTGDASIPTSVPSLNAQSHTVATSASSSGNPIFPFTSSNPAQSQSSQSNANPHDSGSSCPIGSSVIDPALLPSGSAALDLPFEDKGSHHSLQEARALRAWHAQRVSQLGEYIKVIESQIANNFPALSATPAPAAYGQWAPAIAGTGYGDAHRLGFSAENFAPISANLAANPSSFPHGNPPQANHSASNDLSYNNPYPLSDSTNSFMPLDTLLAVGNNFTQDSSYHESQMNMVDVQLNGMPTTNVSGPSQMTNSLEADFSIGQSSNGRGTAASETSGPSADAPSPQDNADSGSPSPSSSDRIPCPINTCGHTSTAKRDMQRHIDDRHDETPNDLIGTGWTLSPQISCPYSGCTLKFRRKDRLKRHLDAGKHRLITTSNLKRLLERPGLW
ncbi:hypothetical protein B0H65DRAFT_245538 [Neurospora tetraspora]|uniref:C2H2-type domain-containing protein n=1 Tax=Neurospora tetraspora TaxID=94610 RepID=A0AAE0MR23_9PEZI|nr:hypothetical protein B0H65DRAFT_245538 [Neurospora tetraspora]